MSALATTPVVWLALLLVALVSVVVLEPLTVLERVAPSGTLLLTLTTKLKVALAPAARVPMVQLTRPVPPTDGVLQVKLGPVPWAKDTKVVPAGTASLRLTLWASDGPLLVML